jgi:ornithine carbamoyltransferase
MAVSLKGRHLVCLHDFTAEEILLILDRADDLKRRYREGKQERLLDGKTLAMIFQKPSLRTRVSYLGPSDIQLGKREATADIARNLSRYADAIMARTFAHADVVGLAENASVPVINGLSDLLHPCQILADLQTVREKKGAFPGKKMAFLGDGNNVAHSLLYGCAKVGMHISLAVPAGYEPNAEVLSQARQDAAKTGAKLAVTHDPGEALRDACAVYTDVWASMGQEEEKNTRQNAMRPYQLNRRALQMALPDAIVLHCLPAHRGEEIVDEVIDGPQSVVFDQAENRLHAQMAVLTQVI